MLAESLKSDRILESAAEVLKANKSNLTERIIAAAEELKSLKKRNRRDEKGSHGGEADSLIAGALCINGINLITREFDGYNINDLRSLSDDIKSF